MGQEPFFLLDNVQREVVIGHYPEGIGMSVGGQDVTEVYGASIRALYFDELVTAGMPTCQADLYAGDNFGIAPDKTELS